MENDLEKALSVARTVARKSILKEHGDLIRQALTEGIPVPAIRKALAAINVNISLTALRYWINKYEPDLYEKYKRGQNKTIKQEEQKPKKVEPTIQSVTLNKTSGGTDPVELIARVEAEIGKAMPESLKTELTRTCLSEAKRGNYFDEGKFPRLCEKVAQDVDNRSLGMFLVNCFTA